MGGHSGIAGGQACARCLLGYGFGLLVIANTVDCSRAHIHFHSVSASFAFMYVGGLPIAPRLMFFNDEVFDEFQFIHVLNAGGHGAVGLGYVGGTANFSAALIASTLCQRS